MKIIKPLRLSILYRPYRWLQKNHLGVSAMALIDMSSTPRLRPEAELWQLAESELKTCNGIIDLAIPKPCAEFLATGYAYTHHQADKTTCTARIQIDKLEKNLMVFGDRHWIDDQPSAPQPFEQMRLDWSRAFGGKNDENNPHGIGFEPENRSDGVKVHRLPNIERIYNRLISKQHLVSKKEIPAPASFCPLDFTWPSRFARIGKKYDKAWLENEFPGFSHDIDWRLFNAAAEDQWWKENTALPEQAAWRIWNMHPEKPVQEGTLPSWKARCFIKRLRLDEEVIEEIAMRNTTVWFFPHLEQMILIWHGSIQINEDDAKDVLQMISALELPHNPRPVSHYLQVLEQRLNKEKGALYAFREKDLIPEEIIGPWLDTQSPSMASILQKNFRDREKRLREQHQERLAEYGQDINTLIPVKTEQALHSNPLKLDELAEFVEKTEQEIAKKRAESELKKAELIAKAKQQGIDIEKKTAKSKIRGPENLHRMQDMLRQKQQETGLDDKSLAQIEQSLHTMYLSSVQSQAPALRLTSNLSQIIRKRIENIMQQGGNFSGMDFTGADMSGLDLRGANFSHALLESACLNHCQLDGANFNEAMLARTEICHASLRGAKLDNASLALAKCEQSDFSAASFKKTQLQETRFDHCHFDHAIFTDLFLQKIFITHCNFQYSQWEACTFMEIELPAPQFHHATLNKVSFIKCKLEHAIFDHSELESCSWVETKANKSCFQSAKLLTCAFAMNSELNQTDFSHATLTECNLRQMPLVNSSFYSATLNNSDLSESNCQSANMQYLNAISSLFTRADFQNASLNNANLTGALMQKCSFNNTDLQETNLFRTDMSQSIINDSTSITGAYIHRTKTLPKRDKDVI
ncbi:DUF2169 domain-containing protein [Xenorhabdus sp. 42]|uniref:DUF2169 domain-containing protein n=1 Tax=Xenorhabdus szentirmaii TaxID=290112 RepID=UPI00199F187A|nr:MULTISPECIES: DUF2169 domain-containing protein [unclassified Xenorhabdus]MBD2792654.1 DUF2169 domain-containing protein [Xenorhabdus sp. CUL]MBD2805768.1 DUF2169 domain-containing protein [Xenorhabdus sp. ZM]MBD2821318.1 DUF2169 domain-containing protein [Xenorhabdus sp. 42]MBD2826588.1 DUF2169 domain-containing protein [Xenorhabdus sp. 5]